MTDAARPGPIEPTHLTGRIEAGHERMRSRWHGMHLFRDRPRPAADAICLLSNDYLALSRHPDIIRAQITSLREQGSGTLMSAVYLRADDAQFVFADVMADYLGSEAVVLCQSGMAANIGLVQVLVAADTPVHLDLRSHASLWQGVVAARAHCRPFRHNEPDDLEAGIAHYGPGLIAVDSLYSVEGDLCPLADLVEIADRHGCPLLVDESHALGVLGPQGRGLTVALGLTDRVAFRTASLSKAFAGRAGLVAASRRCADFFPFYSLQAIFSSAVLPYEVAGLAAALEVIRGADLRRRNLHRQAACLREGLTDLGYDIAPSCTQIISLRPGSESGMPRLQSAFDRRGVFGAPFVAPATPEDDPALRFSVHADLTDQQVAAILEAAAEARTDVFPRSRARWAR
ncbi:alpha-hydroxyketone-type quorum-sensing autoinducer synthase [Streptomyces sp. I05A-00742]|uniref:alpha-hydroxyketone-type quorum-sensing autoinducer synthase n=1 Tax=Streptomyces sp. I05A-00742 TaxID=2732853 RepID=UPI001489A366|nr:alpha-hydroxyketone-type quorum-sensing autoinducer synthase [Streptomyces sp. I05A-00742]